MNKVDEDKLEKLYHRVGLKHNLNRAQIKLIVESPYKFTKEMVDELSLKEVESEEEFNLLKTNFIYKFMGKLHTSYKTIAGRKKQSETFKEINRKKWEK